MKLSIYTSVKNGLFYDYHVVSMLKHHLELADEIIVNEGLSTDGTYEAISRIDPKIKIFRTDWGQPTSFDWFTSFKNAARKACTGDWCILLDCDEFIPEWDFSRLRRHLENTQDVMVPAKLRNFYGNYKVSHAQPASVGWPAKKMLIHKNIPEIEVWGDGSNVRRKDTAFDWHSSSEEYTFHHFGFVRNPARLREKWRNIQGNLHCKKRKFFKLPSFVFNWLPFDWKDPQFLGDLESYEGPHIQAVREDPAEFTRDGFALYRLLTQPRCSMA
jgi:glycosyltransferase involved in cell wall biosynthesis